jgi:hypothetical protein
MLREGLTNVRASNLPWGTARNEDLTRLSLGLLSSKWLSDAVAELPDLAVSDRREPTNGLRASDL